MARINNPPPDEASPAATPPGPSAGGAPISPEVGAMVQAYQTGAARAEAVVPGISSGRDTTPYPAVEPASPFVLVFDSNRWAVIDGKVVPLLYKLQFSAGTNGVDRGADNLPAPALAIAMIEERGHKLIPFMADGTSYLIRVQVGTAKVKKTGQVIPVYSHHTRWETLYPGSTEIQTDTPGYARWLRWLVDNRVIPEPRPYVLERLASQLQTKIGQYRGKANGQHPTLARYEADLAAVNAHRDRLGLGRPAQVEPVTVPT
jgi:hypothetical protein